LSPLEKNPELRKQVEQFMAVSISRFFRDRYLWHILENHVLPMLLAGNPENIKVWSAGCACGEETYSFKIIWDVLQNRLARAPELEFWATDLNPEFLEKARSGIYSLSSLKELPAEFRSKYFNPVQGNLFAVADWVKEGILWRTHNIVSDGPPLADFQIIFLRNNLLTYYRDELIKPALRRVIDTLSPEGFLIIGSHEKLPEGYPELRPFPHHKSIFQRLKIPG